MEKEGFYTISTMNISYIVGTINREVSIVTLSIL